MKNSKIIKMMSVILVAAILVVSMKSNVVSAKEYDFYSEYVKGKKMIWFQYDENGEIVLKLCKKKDKNHMYFNGKILEKISENKYYVEGKGFENGDEISCLFKMKVMKNKIKFTINDGNYQVVGKYFVGTWKRY